MIMTMLKESTGNMYEFITHTWNPIVGRCLHDCKYCYAMHKYGQELKEGIRLSEESFNSSANCSVTGLISIPSFALLTAPKSMRSETILLTMLEGTAKL